jgi:hypothetical protein
MFLLPLATAPDPSIVGPGRLAFAVVGVLALVTALLVVSMMRHIRRVPPEFPAPGEPVGEPDGAARSERATSHDGDDAAG